MLSIKSNRTTYFLKIKRQASPYLSLCLQESYYGHSRNPSRNPRRATLDRATQLHSQLEWTEHSYWGSFNSENTSFALESAILHIVTLRYRTNGNQLFSKMLPFCISLFLWCFLIVWAAGLVEHWHQVGFCILSVCLCLQLQHTMC